MNTTLLVEENSKIQNFLSINLQTWVGTNVLHKSDTSDALEFLKDSETKPNLIIFTIKNEFQSFCSRLSDDLAKIPIIYIGIEKVTDISLTIVESKLDIKPIIKSAAKLLDVTAQDMANLSVPKYFAIPINYFLSIKESSVDVYEEVAGNHSIIYKEFKDFPKNSIVEKIKNKTPALYIKREDRLTFVNHLSQVIASQLKMSDLNEDEQITATELSQQFLQKKLARVGITKETVTIAQKNMKQMTSQSKQFPMMSKLLKRLTKNKTGYLFKHTQLLICVTAHLMDHIDWGNDDQKNKMAFISFFHDIALGTDDQAMIHSEKDLKSSSLSDQEKKLVNQHAQISAELVHKYPKAPMGADVIIRQHHGIVHGVGFSEHFSGNLSPMTIVFILAEDYVHSVIVDDTNFKPKRKIADMREKYPTQRFQKIIDILEILNF